MLFWSPSGSRGACLYAQEPLLAIWHLHAQGATLGLPTASLLKRARGSLRTSRSRSGTIGQPGRSVLVFPTCLRPATSRSALLNAWGFQTKGTGSGRTHRCCGFAWALCFACNEGREPHERNRTSRPGCRLLRESWRFNVLRQEWRRGRVDARFRCMPCPGGTVRRLVREMNTVIAAPETMPRRPDAPVIFGPAADAPVRPGGSRSRAVIARRKNA